MAWTNPRTAAVGDLYTAPWYNAEVRDNLNWVVRPLMAPLTSFGDLVNTASAFDLFGGLVTIPGGTLGTKGALRVTVLGDYKNNSGATQKLTLGINVGGTTVWTDQTTDLPAAVARHDWTLEFLLAAKGTTIFLTGSWHYSTAGGATTGIGDASNATPAAGGPTIVPFGSNSTLGIDMASDRTLQVTGQHTNANANLSLQVQYATFELVGQGA